MHEGQDLMVCLFIHDDAKPVLLLAPIGSSALRTAFTVRWSRDA